MYSTFFGLELAQRGLQAQQAALDVTGHNMANANTEGYTRQIAGVKPSIPLTINGMGKQLTFGTGASMENIERARSSLVDRQFRWENSKYEYWAAKQESLQMVEGLMNEPSEYSLHNDLDKFWNAWSELAKNPENMGARSVLRERASSLVDTLHHIDRQITDLQKDLNSAVKIQVRQINNIADQIQELNIQIKRAEVALDNPNDLRDQRDALVDKLSKLVPVRVTESQDSNFSDRQVGIFKVMIGNENDNKNVLIDDQTVKKLQDPPPEDANSFSRVIWEGDTNVPANYVDLGFNMGRLQANMETRDLYLTKFRTSFNTMAQGLANAVNALHQQGQGLKAETTMTGDGPVGIDFFVNTKDPSATSPPALPAVTAANIALNPVIDGDVDRIATGRIPLDTTNTPPTHAEDSEGNPLVEVGDSEIALAISSLAEGWESLNTEIENDLFGADDTRPVDASSFGEFYGSVIAQMGVDVQQAERMAEGQSVLVNHMSVQKESAYGVSLDEEMANMVKYQKSYAAAARLVTMIDSMLEKVLTMGITR